MGYRIYDWSTHPCSTYCIVRITVFGYKDSKHIRRIDTYFKVLYIAVCTALQATDRSLLGLWA